MDNAFEYFLSKLNYYAYIYLMDFFFLGIIIGLIVFFINIKYYSYRKEVSNLIKTSSIIFVISFSFKVLINDTMRKIFDIIFHELAALIFLTIIIIYILDKLILYKRDWKSLSIENKFLDYIIYAMYFFMIISNMYGVKYFVIALVWQVSSISIKFHINNRSKNNNNKYDSLYDSRKRQLEAIEKIIKESEYKDFAISINGEWGSGKSELIEALMDRSEQQPNYYIYIKPMIVDTQESLIKEFQKSLCNIMNEIGIYCGRNSSLEKYFNEVSQLIQINNKVSISNLIIKEDKDMSYRKLKYDLQRDINLLLTDNKRLVVVIDDFDRVDENKQLGILSFIKEIIDFKGCIVLFALDYNNLENKEVLTSEYLEKFIATKIQLVNVDFQELVLYHSEAELNIKSYINNKQVLSILEEIQINIYDYFDNYQASVSKYVLRLDTEISKAKQEDIKDLNAKKDNIIKFVLENQNKLDNSRRVIHFLKEIKNILFLMDSLYKDDEKTKKFFDIVQAGKIIYLFNFLKVFHPLVYNKIIDLKGLEEFIFKQKVDEMNLEEQYIRILLEDLIPVQNVYFTDEKIEMIRTNSFNFIKDIFINYYFTKNEIDLLTQSGNIVDQIDNNKINLEGDYVQTLKIYQRAILKESVSEEQTEIRINKLINFILEVKNISVVNFIEIASINDNSREPKYYKYYLKEITHLIETNRNIKVYENEKRIILSHIKNIEFDIIIFYRIYIMNLVEISYMGQFDLEQFQNDFKNIESIKKLETVLKKYIENKNNKNENGYFYIKKTIMELFEDVDKNKYEFLDIKILRTRVTEFIEIQDYLNKIKLIEINLESLDKYKEACEYFYIDSINKAMEEISEIATQSEVDYYKIHYFQKLLNYIVIHKHIHDVTKECKNNISNFYRRLDYKQCYNELQWINISINSEKIINGIYSTNNT